MQGYVLSFAYFSDAITSVLLLHEKFVQFDRLRAVVFHLNLKYLHVKITKFLRVVVRDLVWHYVQITYVKLRNITRSIYARYHCKSCYYLY